MHAKFFIFGADSSFSKQERAASEHHARLARPSRNCLKKPGIRKKPNRMLEIFMSSKLPRDMEPP